MSSHLQPIEPQHHKAMNDVAEIMDTIFQGYGFTLFIFPLDGTPGNINYISNANRKDMLVALKEFIAANEGRAHSAPASTQ